MRFLPGAGLFYDCCDRRRIECGVAKLMVQLDMLSWLRLTAHIQFAAEIEFWNSKMRQRLCKCGRFARWQYLVSGWRVSRSSSVKMLSGEVYWAKQCSDADRP
jgi:hypothetical protein